MKFKKYTFRIALIRISHWEYWPFAVVYFPVFFYWTWLLIRSGAAFFNTANPRIGNGGFLMESKKEIYDLMPPAFYPRTVLIQPSVFPGMILQKLSADHISFPVIAKPDIGMRGMQVEKIHTAADLLAYATRSKVPFLVQEYIAYEKEAGIFYYRIPGETRGHISGIVEKEYLRVTGDGRSTIEQLLTENNRFLLQLDSLVRTYGDQLNQVLPSGETRTLVPYGNHSRGAKFIDKSDAITPELEDTIDAICQAIPDFYFGRLDIKYKSWEELVAGRHFSIIELNGAGSEPTHIYDPKHSIFFAWKEIFRHIHLLYRISVRNKKLNNYSYMSLSAFLALLQQNKKYVRLLNTPAQKHEYTGAKEGPAMRYPV